jgi:hypothetical protein
MRLRGEEPPLCMLHIWTDIVDYDRWYLEILCQFDITRQDEFQDLLWRKGGDELVEFVVDLFAKRVLREPTEVRCPPHQYARPE